MNLQLDLLKALSYKKNFNIYLHVVDTERLSKDTQLILNDYAKYFNLYGEKEDDVEIDWDTFRTHFTQEWHKKDLKKRDIDYFNNVFDEVTKRDHKTTSNIVKFLNENFIIEEIIDSLGVEYDPKKEKLIYDRLDVCEVKHILDGVLKCERAGISASDVTVDKEIKLIPWCLPELQRETRGLGLGDLVTIYAYTEVGKGALCVQQAAVSILSKPTGPILYFTSEDAIEKLYGRLYSCIYHKHMKGGFKEVMERFDEIRGKFIDSFGDHSFLAYEIGFGDMDLIVNETNNEEPSLIIIDMGDTLCPSSEDALSLKRVWDRLRQIANKVCPVIVTTQAVKTEYWDEKEGRLKNKKWLSIPDCYGSNVGKQAASTMLLGISKDLNMDGLRYIHTSKNKGHSRLKMTFMLEDKFSRYMEL